MQTEGHSIRRSPTYRERLSPSLWVLVASAVCAPIAALVFAPVDATLSLVAGLLVGVVIVGGLIAASPVVEIDEDKGLLRAGPARIDVALLADPVALTGDEAREARGARLDPRSWMLIRGGIDGIVVVGVEDPEDPAPAWVISTRTPDRVAAAIRRAQLRQRTPRR